MKTGNLFSTNHGAWLTTLCALSPVALMIALASVTLHIRFGFGYLPDPMLKSLPTVWPKMPDRVLAGFMLFAVFAITRLIVVAMHHRDFGLSLRSSLTYMFVYFAGWIALVVIGTSTDWLACFMD